MLKSRGLRWAGYAAKMEETSYAYRNWWRTSWKGPLERPRRRWEDNIKVGLRKIPSEDQK
jgi:hypothetical protein